MNLYIDEHYDHENNRTILVILRISERDVQSVYKSIKKIILKKEANINIRQYLLNELKSRNLRDKKYWGSILNKIYTTTSIHHSISLPCLPREKERFQELYAKAISNILDKEDISIFADNINNKSFIEPIIKKVNDKRFHFHDSVSNKGIQLADLVASTHRGRENNDDKGTTYGYRFHLNPRSKKDIDKLRSLLEKMYGSK